MKITDDDPWEDAKRFLLASLQFLGMVLAAFVVLEIATADALRIPTRACIDLPAGGLAPSTEVVPSP